VLETAHGERVFVDSEAATFDLPPVRLPRFEHSRKMQFMRELGFDYANASHSSSRRSRSRSEPP